MSYYRGSKMFCEVLYSEAKSLSTEPPETYSTNCKMYHLNFGKCSSEKSNFIFLEWSSCLTDIDWAEATRTPCVAASRITRPHEDSAIVSCSNVFDTDDQSLEVLKVS
jgi:hypothetical protein